MYAMTIGMDGFYICQHLVSYVRRLGRHVHLWRETSRKTFTNIRIICALRSAFRTTTT
jgi:hypothetical protein